jgi:multidrug transporter EmrE-like cation transporter
MAISTLLLILASITLSAVAQIILKLGMSSATVKQALAGQSAPGMVLTVLLNPVVLTGLVLYGVAAMVWLGVLARAEVSQAYPFVGLGFVLTALVGYFLFGDNMSALRIGGTFLVIAGIFLIARS